MPGEQGNYMGDVELSLLVRNPHFWFESLFQVALPRQFHRTSNEARPLPADLESSLDESPP